MDISHLITAPNPQDFTPLAEHQAQTPATFFGARAVLHVHVQGCRVQLSRAALAVHPIFAPLAKHAPGAAINGASHGGGGPQGVVACDDVDVFVTSENLLLAIRECTPAAIAIPYPAISIHATQNVYASSSSSDDTTPYATSAPSESPDQQPRQAVYLQLDPSFASRRLTNPDGDDGADDPDGAAAVEMLIIPPAAATPSSDTGGGAAQLQQQPAQGIFEALSACADLHPDVDMDDGADDDEGSGAGQAAALGGMGGGGWITAENMHEFEGEFADAEEDEGDGGNGDGLVAAADRGARLGPGAGTRRPREEGVEDGEGGDAEEPSADAGGGQDETKWRKTG